MKLAVLFSGGKDSVFACYKAMEKHDVVCLISIISSNQDSYMFHTPNINLAKYQAEAMEIPLITHKTKGEKEIELEDLKKAIEKAKTEFAIEGVVTGALKSEYQASRIQKICDELELECINPLWNMDQEEEMREVIKLGFKFIITKVAAYGLDKSWLGRIITNEDVDKLMEINKKIGINVAFEGGEAETLMIDGPIFKSKLEIKKANIVMENEFTGIYNIEEVVEKDL